MQLNELRRRLETLRDRGFVESQRQGPTGVGYTLERYLGVSENNLPIPDIGGRVEIKATRSASENLISLFTFNRAAWQQPMAETVRRWGYFDAARDRQALYSTVTANAVNPQGLHIKVAADGESLSVVHASGEVVATWDMYEIVGKFMAKFERLLFVTADAQGSAVREKFHYVSAILLSEPQSRLFRDGFHNGYSMIDIRAYLRPSGAARNHGTAFRVYEKYLPELFGQQRELL